MRYLLEITQEEKSILRRAISRECKLARQCGDNDALSAALRIVHQLGGELDDPGIKRRNLSPEERARRAELMRRIRVNGAQKREPMVEIRGSVTATNT